MTSVAEDLEVSHPTVKRWLGWLSQLFYIYSVSPYSKKLARSLKKQPKIYLWDWCEIKNIPILFENMVANHFHKACNYWTDMGIGTFELYYLRDKEKREVDFFITKDKRPWIIAECKSSAGAPSPHLFYFHRIFRPPITLQICAESGIHESFEISKNEKGFLISADAFLKLLP